MNDFFAIGNDELEEAPVEEEFFFCEKCDKNHPIEHAKSACSECIRNEQKECHHNASVLGFYRCEDSSYLYSLNGKQVR